jgi:hypothetical protein
LHQQKEVAVAGRIARFLQRQSPERAEVTAALAQLAQLAAAHPDLCQAATLQSALIRTLYATPAPVSYAPLTAEDAVARLAGGVPLLCYTAFPCAARSVRDMFVRLWKTAMTANTEAASETTASNTYTVLGEAVRRGRLDVWMLGKTLLSGDALTLPGQLEAQGYAADLVMTLLRLACLLFLEQVAAQLVPLRTAQRVVPGLC